MPFSDHCIKPYTLAPEGGPTLPQSMLLFNRSYIRVKDILIICHPVPQLATFSYPRMKCTGLVDGNHITWFVCFDGIRYKNQMVAVWTDEADLQLPSTG
ncbi:hypothetical protein D915_010517 [Fasciola hepatica]|uniref:Uncharacterized protein n=1 Tax=Fasciola hepatica TaxID=6192 RepID=A0A2H1BRT1_FASHE|nr:hypothetical protein D915_010517 [Fasciola hepatica]